MAQTSLDKRKLAIALTLSFASLSSTQVLAGGISLLESSAASIGNAHAGGAAGAEDASTVFQNPAGLTRLPGSHFTAVLSAIDVSAKFANNGSTSAIGTPATGGNGGNGGTTAVLPSLFFATDISPVLKFGIGVFTPIGLKTDYDSDWVGRYQALKSDVKTININPSLAYKVSDTVSLGAGVSAQRADAELTKAVDFGSLCFANVGPAGCTAFGILPQARDGTVKVKGSDWGYGFNLGALFTLSSDTRVGLAYRSRIKQEISGQATFSNPTLPGPFAALTASRATTDSDAKANLDLPESVSASFFSQLDKRWSIMGDVTWVKWSRLDELRVRFANGAPDSVTPEQWRDTTRVALAVNYQLSDAWKLRAGAAYDESPVKDDFRTPRVPDNHRVWLAFGAGYRFSKQDTFDVGYAHLFIKDGPINSVDPSAGRLRGDYEDSADILGVQFNHMF